MIKRFVLQDMYAALQDTPVLLVNGARQTGKTTLVKNRATSIRRTTFP